MDTVLASLKDTPIRTILVITGIPFLLLAIARQLAGRIVVAPERQRWAAVIGSVLLAPGLVLYVVSAGATDVPEDRNTDARTVATIGNTAAITAFGNGIKYAVPVADSTAGRSPLVGEWSTMDWLGDYVDPGSGAFRESATYGEWYNFYADGSYSHTMIGTGTIISGAVVSKGTFQLNGARLLLRQRTVSWYPKPRSAANHPKYVDRQEPKEYWIDVKFQSQDRIVIRGGDGVNTFQRRPGR